jgi:serine/threonine protein kinase/tetratricopeptide (TPR) repeat protein
MKCPNCDTDNPEDSKYCKECAAKLISGESSSALHTKTLQTPVKDLIDGAMFAERYRIIEELGRGGMGVVYKAEDSKLKRTVALKFLPVEVTHIPEFKDRFVREAQAAAALDHPNICTVYEFDETADKTYISMAYLGGQSLKKKIDAGPLELDDALGIAVQVAEGLQAAHKKGVIHRDIKSSNIMLTEEGQAKILDFGLARIADTTLVTKAGTAMGTIAYMSPEQTRGEGIDHRTDIWSLGVVLYEMLSGQLPFKGEHEQAVLYSILNEKPASITRLRPEVPASVEQVISRALKKKVDERYRDAGELLDDLRAILEGAEPKGVHARLRERRIRKKKRAFFIAGAAGLAIIATVALLSVFMGRAGGMDSIAVLPMKNLTGDPQQEYFSDGITDALINELAKISALRVISRQSVMRYKGSELPLSEIAKELDVDAVVEASVLSLSGKVQIRAKLIQASTEQNLWAESYEREMSDILALQSEMAQTIAQEIKVNLTSGERTRLSSTRPVNPAAYDAILKGQFHLYKLTSKDLETALQYFELALDNDPDSALAYSGIAKVWLARITMGLAPTSQAGPKAKDAAMKALELDSNQSEVHFALAWVAWLDWDWTAAEAAYRQAIALNPNSASARAYYSNFLYVMGNPEEGRRQIELALVLDPLNPLFQAIYAMDLMYERRYDEVIELLRTTLKTSPNDPVTLSTLRSAYHQKQMYEEALKIWKASYAAKGDDEAVEALTLGYAEGGYSGALSRVAETFIKRSRTTSEYVTPWQIGTLYTRAGKVDEALEWLEKACDERDSNMPYIRVDPIFDILREDPRFQELIRRMNFPNVN